MNDGGGCIRASGVKKCEQLKLKKKFIVRITVIFESLIKTMLFSVIYDAPNGGKTRRHCEYHDEFLLFQFV